jgi:hypothetical protein
MDKIFSLRGPKILPHFLGRNILDHRKLVVIAPTIFGRISIPLDGRLQLFHFVIGSPFRPSIRHTRSASSSFFTLLTLLSRFDFLIPLRFLVQSILREYCCLQDIRSMKDT